MWNGQLTVSSDIATLFASHFGLLALLMAVGSFLQFPLVSRVIIITATPLNCYLKLTSGMLCSSSYGEGQRDQQA